VTSHSDTEEKGQNVNNSNIYNSINGHPDAGKCDKKDGEILEGKSSTFYLRQRLRGIDLALSVQLFGQSTKFG
jgi:hypothetical protein